MTEHKSKQFKLDSSVPLWDIKEVARFLSISERKTRDLVASYELRGIKVGGLWRFHPDTVNAYLLANIAGPRNGRRIEK